ncbi:MAG: membrane protein insertion efficiency factor YidD [Ruthenibacterium sp.]
MIRKLFIFPIKLYQKFISPMLGSNCRFYPTCSAYAVQAIEIHGVVKGILLASWRILRCNPLCKGGVDYVPPKGKWRNERHSE